MLTEINLHYMKLTQVQKHLCQFSIYKTRGIGNRRKLLHEVKTESKTGDMKGCVFFYQVLTNLPRGRGEEQKNRPPSGGRFFCSPPLNPSPDWLKLVEKNAP